MLMPDVGEDKSSGQATVRKPDHPGAYFEELRGMVAPMTEPDRRRSLGENVARAYRLGKPSAASRQSVSISLGFRKLSETGISGSRRPRNLDDGGGRMPPIAAHDLLLRGGRGPPNA